MACSFTIDVDRTDFTFDCWGGKQTFIVTVDESATNNSYYIDNEGDYGWFNIERNRNILLVRCDPYFEYDKVSTEDMEDPDYNARMGYIHLVHNCDADQAVDITITQRGVEYNILNESTEDVIFNPLDEQTVAVPITVKGGSERFYIKSVKFYSEDTYTDSKGNEQHYEIEYDDGLILTADNDNSELIIQTFGRTFVDEGNFYEITLAHKDYRYKTCTVDVYYKDNPIYINNDDKSVYIVSPTSNTISFDYRGLTVNNTQDYAEIYIEPSMVGESGRTDDGFTDYGYDYEITSCSETEGDEECSWLTITENPTSLSFACEPNCGTDERNAVITIYANTNGERSEKSPATITVTQGINDNYSISATTTNFVVDYDTADETYSTTFRVYGGEKKYTYSKISDTWLTVVIYSNYDDYCSYCTYYMDITVNSINDGKDTRTANIVLCHSEQTSACTTISFSQKANTVVEGISLVEVKNPWPSENGELVINLIVTPENSQLALNSTGTWCHCSYNEEDKQVTITCDNNYWGVTRTCMVFFQNASNPTNELAFQVTQNNDNDDGYAVFSVTYITT